MGDNGEVESMATGSPGLCYGMAQIRFRSLDFPQLHASRTNVVACRRLYGPTLKPETAVDEMPAPWLPL
jgi:hypothetical protein